MPLSQVELVCPESYLPAYGSLYGSTPSTWSNSAALRPDLRYASEVFAVARNSSCTEIWPAEVVRVLLCQKSYAASSTAAFDVMFWPQVTHAPQFSVG